MINARQTCNLSVNYAEVIGDRILPFVIALDLENSVISPVAGENQRFCYTVTANGQDTSAYADLSHLLLGICDDIAETALRNVTVEIDGVQQEVVIGENVEIFTPAQPDPPTGCPGLKFDFPLNKVTGFMRFCFELETARAVGPVAACLFGGNVTASGLALCGPVCGTVDPSCAAIGYQRATVCTPVTVTPYATTGETTARCCGAPTVVGGTAVCDGVVGGSLDFTISQAICVEVPVRFSALASVGSYSVRNDGASGTPCVGCAGEEETPVAPVTPEIPCAAQRNYVRARTR